MGRNVIPKTWKGQTEYERYCQLGWWVLEQKILYYSGKSQVEDRVYDSFESEYKQLAAKLGQPASASDMVGYDLNRPSVILAYNKLKSEGLL